MALQPSGASTSRGSQTFGVKEQKTDGLKLLYFFKSNGGLETVALNRTTVFFNGGPLVNNVQLSFSENKLIPTPTAYKKPL